MSIDTHMLLRTPLPAAEVRAALVRDPALAHLGLLDHGERVGMAGKGVSLVVQPWEEEDRDLIEGGFETATVRVKLIPAHGRAGWDPYRQAFAAVLRLVPGDACAQEQGGGPLGLLRLGGVVYVNPDWVSPEDLSDFGYTPAQVVVGIPPGLAAEAP